MRKLMWFVIGLAAACGLCAYGTADLWIRGTVPAVGLAALLWLCRKKGSLCIRVALVMLGLAVGLGRYAGFREGYLDTLEGLDGRTGTVTLRISDFGRETDYGILTEAVLEREGTRYSVRLYLDEGERAVPGLLVTGPFRFSLTAPKEDPVSYLSGEGIFLTARQADEVTARRDPEIRWMDRVAQLRLWLRSAMEEAFPEDAVPFAQALLLGDTSAIDYETDTDFKISGIRHVIAVSGLHVSILVALLSAVTFRRRFLTVPVGLGVLVLFAALAGFSPSVSRACIMAGLLLLAMLFEREYDGATALSFAAGVMLLLNPLVIASVSFQLSVASVAGIYLFEPRIRKWLEGILCGEKKQNWRKWVSTSVSVTLSAMTLTTPLCAYYFGMVSLVGVVTNLLALWVISGIFYGIMAVCLLYALWVPGAVILARSLAWPIRYVLGVARIMADLPLAAVYMDSIFIVGWLVFVYILLGVFLLDRRRSPGQLICCGIVGLAIALLASWQRPEDAGTVLTVLDVGQGQCILLESEGRIWMVDCGGDSDEKAADAAAEYLLSRGIDRLDGLILTHMDADHAGGAALLLSRIGAELVILPDVHTVLPGETVIWAEEDLSVRAGDSEIRVYAPTYPGNAAENSLCVLFDTEKCDILITGDRDGFGERMLLRSGTVPEVDVLIAGHHGSKNATCEELLDALSPETVCISVGRGNPFGHPAAELLQRLAEHGCQVYRTDIHGTITIRR